MLHDRPTSLDPAITQRSEVGARCAPAPDGEVRQVCLSLADDLSIRHRARGAAAALRERYLHDLLGSELELAFIQRIRATRTTARTATPTNPRSLPSWSLRTPGVASRWRTIRCPPISSPHARALHD